METLIKLDRYFRNVEWGGDPIHLGLKFSLCGLADVLILCEKFRCHGETWRELKLISANRQRRN